MKKLVCFTVLLSLLYGMPLKGQDMFDQSLRDLEELNNITYDYVASFMEFPNNHDNTLKVFRGLQEVSKFYDDQYNKRFELLSRFDNYKTRQYVDQIEKMKLLVDAIDEYVGCVAGYVRAGVDSPTFDQMLKPLFQQFGWESKIIPIQCDDIMFCEYSKDGFKMLLAYNTRPIPDRFRQDITKEYHDNQVDCYTYFREFRETSVFTGLVVRGGKYRLVQYKDSQKSNYHQLTKATSKRLN